MPWLYDILLSALFLLVIPVGAPLVRWWEQREGLQLDGATRAAASAALGIAWCQLGGMVLAFTQQLHALSAPAGRPAGPGPCCRAPCCCCRCC
jgi:hypothetical protein